MRLFSAPGKLVVAGEYGVLHGAPGVVAAVSRRARVGFEPGERWAFAAVADESPGDLSRASPIVQACFAAVDAARGLPAPQRICADTRAFGGEFGKFGLGSSASVAAALTWGLLALQGLEDPDLAFQLTMQAHRRAQGNGSGIDVAASVYGGLLRFEVCPPPHGATVGKVIVRPRWRLAAVWSGASAATGPMIDRVEEYWRSRLEAKHAFLLASRFCADALVAGLQDDDAERVAAAIGQNRRLLVELGRQAGLPIETPELEGLAAIAEGKGAAGKLSGSGGGDCAIALAHGVDQAESVKAAWRSAGFLVLDLGLDDTGVQEESQWSPNPGGRA
ncbi:MAG: hypothetical protein KGR26_03805 [Cyanobacteria bacterium REEB65]|nr:hypothetical protein [Cyanobacteria bacterium REEB65]